MLHIYIKANGGIKTDGNTVHVFADDTSYPFNVSYTYDKTRIDGEYIDDEEIWIWEKVIEKHTYDFPTILQLEHILELIIDKKIDVKTTGEKHEYLNGEIEYSRTFCSEGFEINVLLSSIDMSYLNFVKFLYNEKINTLEYLNNCIKSTPVRNYI